MTSKSGLFHTDSGICIVETRFRQDTLKGCPQTQSARQSTAQLGEHWPEEAKADIVRSISGRSGQATFGVAKTGSSAMGSLDRGSVPE